MKTLLRWACIALLTLLFLSLNGIISELPVSRTEKTAEKYGGWSGVLRVWVCEGWSPGSGSLQKWLSAAASAFEKRNNGVYMQFTYVSKEAMAAFTYGTDNPPDLVIFAPAMLTGPDDLLRTSLSQSLRAELRGYADGYALPVAMGGYAWAINRARIEGDIPEGAVFALQEDDAFHARSAAALAMFTGGREEGALGAGYGVDLGLPDEFQTPVPETTARAPMSAGAGSEVCPDAYARFTRGEADAMLVTQADITKLNRLSDMGRAPDWDIAATGACFTDQLALAGVVNWPRDDLTERQTLCVSFLTLLISEEMQARLTTARAFSVLTAPSLYAQTYGMKEMERFLSANAIAVPGAFHAQWKRAAGDAINAFLRGGADAVTLWTDIRSGLPN